jgi:hypothetical protein
MVKLRGLAVGAATFSLAIVLPHLCTCDRVAEQAAEWAVELGCGDRGAAGCEAIGEWGM